MRKMYASLLPIVQVGAVLVILTLAQATAAEHPTACLKEIITAVENGDASSVQALVDIDGITDSGLRLFLSEAQKPQFAGQLPPLLSLMLAQMSADGLAAETVRNALKGEIRAFIINGIKSGAFACKKYDPGKLSGLLAPLFANASLGRKEVTAVGEARMVENGWLLPFQVYDYGSQGFYDIVGRFEADSCRLTQVENMQDLLAQILQESLEAEGE